MGLIYSQAIQAATTLTDVELDSVSGGNVNVHENVSALSQDIQQPGQDNPNFLPQTDLQNPIGVDLSLQAVAVMQAELNLNVQRNVKLSGSTQKNVHALNIENIISSDAIVTNNIMIARHRTSGTFNQNNELTQLNQQQGAIDSSASGYRYETTVQTTQVTENHSHINYFYTDQINYSDTRHHEEIQWDIGVDKVPHSSLLDFADKVFNVLGGDLDFQNINTGFVFAGQGRVQMKEEASIKINGQVTVEVNIPFTNIELFDIKIPFKVIDISIAPFEFNDINGVIKAVLFDGGSGINNGGMFDDDEMSYSSSDYFFRDNSLIQHSFVEDIYKNSFSESFENNVFIGGQIGDSKADIVSMSDSKLNVNSSSDVSIHNSAQQNVNAMNVVNSAATISANSLNINVMNSRTIKPSTQSSLLMNQNNRFKQRL
jgi:hypothetical protein